MTRQTVEIIKARALDFLDSACETEDEQQARTFLHSALVNVRMLAGMRVDIAPLEQSVTEARMCCSAKGWI